MDQDTERKFEELYARIVKIERDVAIMGVEFLSIKNDLKDIKDSLTWVTRLIIGALILAVISFIVSGGISIGK